MKVVALLPIKAHSERVPGKNFKFFCGRPLYAVILESLLGSEMISKVVINTDSEDFRDELSANYPQVQVHMRPEAICGDFVSMNKIIEHDISLEPADIYLQTHTTNPVLSTATIDAAISSFIENREKYDSLFSVTSLQTRLYWQDGKAINHNPNELLRTQDLPVVYEENSCLYLFTKDSFSASDGKRIGVNPMLFPINKLEAADIDEPEDFLLAEAVYQLLNK